LISGTTNPAKVIGFLDVTGIWDPSLMFVMGGAIAIGFFGFRFAKTRRESLFGRVINLNDLKSIDAKLIFGSAIFGMGWGLSGFCPGPAIASIGTGARQAILVCCRDDRRNDHCRAVSRSVRRKRMFDVILPVAGVWANIGVMAAVGLLIAIRLWPIWRWRRISDDADFDFPGRATFNCRGHRLGSTALPPQALAPQRLYRNHLIDKTLSAFLLMGAMVGTGLGIAAFNKLNTLGQFEIFIAIAYVMLLGSVGSLMLNESLLIVSSSAPQG